MVGGRGRNRAHVLHALAACSGPHNASLGHLASFHVRCCAKAPVLTPMVSIGILYRSIRACR